LRSLIRRALTRTVRIKKRDMELPPKGAHSLPHNLLDLRLRWPRSPGDHLHDTLRKLEQRDLQRHNRIDRHHNRRIHQPEGVKNFSRETFEMSSIHSENPGNKSVRIQKPPTKHPQHTLTVALRFTIKPTEEREKYVAILNAMIKRVEKIINSKKTKTKQRLRAMQVLTDLIRTSYGMVRDVEVEELEREVTALEEEEGETT